MTLFVRESTRTSLWVAIVPYQSEPWYSATASAAPPSSIVATTLLLRGSMRLTLGVQDGSSPLAPHTAELSAASWVQALRAGIVATMRSVCGSMRTTTFEGSLTLVQIDPALAAIHTGPESDWPLTGITSTTLIVAGSILETEVVGSPSWLATQTKPAKTVTPMGPAPLGARVIVRVTRLYTGSIRLRVLPGKLVSQIAPAPTAITDAGSGVGMEAITALVRGLRRVTVCAGPLATQTEPKAVSTLPGEGMAIDTTRRPAGGSVAVRASSLPAALLCEGVSVTASPAGPLLAEM